MRYKYSKGFSILEALISAGIVLFVMFSIFYALGNILTSSILEEKRVELTRQLDNKVSEFMITGDFDTTGSDNIVFAKVGSGDQVAEFSATNNDYNLTIIKRAFEIVGVDDIFTRITNVECTAVSNGHCACTVSNEDRLQRCMELIGTDDQNDPNVAQCQEQHGGTNPNEAGFQCASACESELNPSCMNLVVICHDPGGLNQTMVVSHPSLSTYTDEGDHLGAC